MYLIFKLFYLYTPLNLLCKEMRCLNKIIIILTMVAIKDFHIHVSITVVMYSQFEKWVDGGPIDIQQYLRSTDPLMSGHLLCRDTISMYGLLYHVNVPLMSGHLLDADSGQDILVFIPC